MNKSRITLALCALLIVVTGTVSLAAPPPLPCRFYGTVDLDGASAPAGGAVTASIGGVQYAATAVFTIGSSSVYVIDVPGDDPDTPGSEGGQAADIVVFQVDGSTANNS